MVWLANPAWRKRRSIRCKWTDLFGSVACLLLGLWLWIPLLGALIEFGR